MDTAKQLKGESNMILDNSLSAEILSEGTIDNIAAPTTSSAGLKDSDMLSVAVPEENDPNKLRIYHLSTRRQTRSTLYYKCTKCELIAKKFKGSNNKDDYVPYLKVMNGRIVGSAYPEHYPDCEPVPKNSVSEQEINDSRIEIWQNSPIAAVKVNTGYNLRPLSSITMDHGFDASEPNIKRHKISEIEHLLRFISETCTSSNLNPVTAKDSIINTCETLNSDDYVSVIVPETDGMSIRIYNRGTNKTSESGEIYYHCSKCDNLCRKSNDGSVPAALKVENNLVADLHPAHHANCLPTSLESLRGLGEELKKFCVVANRRIISLKDVIETEFKTCKQPEADFTADDYGENWNIVANEEIIGPECSSPVMGIAEQGCSCRRLYEENFELYQEMLRNLDEMRSVVGELKRMSGMGTADYYIDGGSMLQEEGIDNSAVYVVDE